MGFLSKLGSVAKSVVTAPVKATIAVAKPVGSIAKTAVKTAVKIPVSSIKQTASFISKPSAGGFMKLLTSPVAMSAKAGTSIAKTAIKAPFSTTKSVFNIAKPLTPFGMAKTLAAKPKATPPGLLKRTTSAARPFAPAAGVKRTTSTPGGIFGKIGAALTRPTTATRLAPGAAFVGKPSTSTAAAAAAPAASYAAPPPTTQASYTDTSNDGSYDPNDEDYDDDSEPSDLEAALIDANASGSAPSTVSRQSTMSTDEGDEMPFEYGGGGGGGSDGDGDGEYAFDQDVETVRAPDGVDIPSHMYDTRADEEGDDDGDATLYAENLGGFFDDLKAGATSFGKDAAKEGAKRLLEGGASALSKTNTGPKPTYVIPEPGMSTGKKMVIGAAIAVPTIIFLSRMLRPKTASNPRSPRRRRRR